MSASTHDSYEDLTECRLSPEVAKKNSTT